MSNQHRQAPHLGLLFLSVLIQLVAYFSSGSRLTWPLIALSIIVFLASLVPPDRLGWLTRKPALWLGYGLLQARHMWPVTVLFVAALVGAQVLAAREPGSVAGIAGGPIMASGNAPPAAGSLPAIEISAVQVVGSEGSGPGQFREPHGIAVAPNGEIYVADTGNKRVQVLSPEGKFLREIKQGKEPFKQVFDVAATANGEIWVLDSERASIERFSSDGKYLAGIGESVGFYFPRGIALDAEGNIYVADTGGSRIVKLSQAGQIVFGWGEKGKAAGQFTEPSGVVVDARANLFAVDPTNGFISAFSIDGNLLGSAVIERSGPFNGPRMVIERTGSILVSIPELHLVRRYSSQLQPLAEFGAAGNGSGQFRLPTFMALGGDSLWVTDSGNHRVQKFNLR